MFKFVSLIVTILKSARLLLIVFCSFLLFSSPIQAYWGASLSAGYGVGNIFSSRFGVLKNFGCIYGENNNWPLYFYGEGAFYNFRVQGNAIQTRFKLANQHGIASTLAGVFRIERAYLQYIGWPYFDIGLGLAYWKKREIAGRQLGKHLQFEDRLGFGLRLGEHKEYELGYRFIHFSNAYTADPNHGINLHFLVFNYWF